MQQWLWSFCWTSRFSVHWNAKPVLSPTADQPADKQSKSRWICGALIKGRRKDGSGAVKQVGGRAGKSVPKKVWHILHPLERNSLLLSARILLCSAARGGSLTLPHSFGMFLLGSLGKITQVLPCISCPCGDECSWYFKESRSMEQAGLCFPAGRCPAELACS